MIFPSLTLLGLVLCTIGVTYDFSQFKPGDDVAALANGWIIADCVFTVFSLLALIAWKLWRVHSIANCTPSGGRTLMNLGGVLHQRLCCAVEPPLPHRRDAAIVGAANMLIYVRVGLGWTHTPVGPSTPIRFGSPKSSFGVDSMDIYVGPNGKKSVGLVCHFMGFTVKYPGGIEK
ncbi:hypothetical protein B0H17DRAFT_1124056 [Mycena rosella]|uniref:Uncharacterized protein n=1 Tax=Mycena rosella TaxID=1033263 RepID=A0AAD7H467_MYCRO|nr:hypothetical protein B0H17DRAFT_1124056 [Mycena rosella]